MNKLFYKVASLVVCLCLFSCSEEVKEKQSKSKHEIYKGPALESKDLHVIQTDSASQTMVLDAKTQIIMNNDDQEYPEGISVTFYEGKEVVTSTIVSNYAFYDDANDKWKLEGDVKIVNTEKGQKMDTQLMFWSPSVKDSNNIFVPDSTQVVIVEPDQELQGFGLRATEDFSYYHIKKPSGQKWLTD